MGACVSAQADIGPPDRGPGAGAATAVSNHGGDPPPGDPVPAPAPAAATQQQSVVEQVRAAASTSEPSLAVYTAVAEPGALGGMCPVDDEVAPSGSQGDPSPVHPCILDDSDDDLLWARTVNFGGKTCDVWGTVQRMCEHVAGATGATCVSITIISSSQQYAKHILHTPDTSTSSHMVDLCKIADVPTPIQVTSSQVPIFMHVKPEDMPLAGKLIPKDCYRLLDEYGCTSFAVLPLVAEREALGALTLAGQLDMKQASVWCAALCPWVSLYLADAHAVRTVDAVEHIQTATSLNSLTWFVTTELCNWFQWGHPDDAEARLVLLSEDQSAALVLSKSVTARPESYQDSPLNSFDNAVPHPASTDGLQASGQNAGSMGGGSAVPRTMVSGGTTRSIASSYKQSFDGLLGTQMTLNNTLTKRCLVEGSRLLFVADVMAALRKYGEPWKDVFLEQAFVTNPSWIIAAPVVSNGQHVAVIIWLSSTRMNSSMLAQAAKITVPPLLYALAKQLKQHLNYNAPQPVDGPEGGSQASLSSYPWHTLMSARSVDSNLVMSAAIDSQEMDISNKPVRYTVARSESASTQALMKLYHSAIYLNRASRTLTSHEHTPPYEEVEVIAKAGQGAFGSVYVAMWKGLVVAVKVMKQQVDGRRTMRTAWELAVTRSLQHANVVNVLAVYTDMAVEKRSKRVIRFIPSVPQEVDSYVAGNMMSTLPVDDALEGLPRCQVIVMEYCNLGPLHHYISERRAAWNAGPDGAAQAGSTGPSQVVGLSLPGSPANITPLTAAVMSGMDDTPRGGEPNPFTTTQNSMNVTFSRNRSMDSNGRLPNSQLVEMGVLVPTLIEVAEAMQYMHQNGVIHLDLKPENILLKVSTSDTRGFTAKVSDFGLSELFTPEGPLMGELGGTVTHIAPEVVLQRKVIPPCDVYSFGIVMWEILTGQRPYHDLLQSNMDKKSRDKLILTKVAHEGMRPEFSPHMPIDYVQLAQRCWAADPMMRPTFKEVLVELRQMYDKYVVRPSSSASHPGPSQPTSSSSLLTRKSMKNIAMSQP